MTLDLDTLFRCPATAKTIAVKHCLRRQGEKRLGLPVYGACQRCELGRANRAAAHVLVLTCKACGAGLIGDVACATCAERALETQSGPARGFLEPGRTEVSERIWSKDAPDAPFGPPPTQIPERTHPNYSLTGPLPRRARDEAEEELEADELDARDAASNEVEKPATPAEPPAEARNNPRNNPSPISRPGALTPPPPPAHPAPAITEEDEMQRKPKACCGSKGPRCLSGCTAKKPAPPAPAKIAAARPARMPAKPGDVLGELEALRERARERREAIDREAQTHMDAITALREEDAKLRAFLGMDREEPARASA